MKSSTRNIQWIDGIKAFAIIAILLNHFVESFGSGPWFSNPDSTWPDFSTRIANLFPTGGNLAFRSIKFLGWLGDMGPGVFIALSGLALTLSSLNKPLKPIAFYRKRLLRIYPLYITIHLLILIVGKYWFKWDLHFFSVPTLFSIVGLRFTDSLFFYINPSWWFIWLIIQVYILFPFLLNFLKKKGVRSFLLVTFALTILSRLAGLLGFTYSHNLYYWMTGLFAGTRLFEFTFGMYIGYLLFNDSLPFANLLKNRGRVFLYAFGIYIVGFVASWTYAGSLVANIFVTVGLTGIFYAIFETLFRKEGKIKNGLIWMGKNSFSVFLLHQPLMMYVSPMFKGYEKAAVLLLVIILSFVIGYIIDRIVSWAIAKVETQQEAIQGFLDSKVYRLFIFAALAVALASSFAFMLGKSKFAGIEKLLLFVLVVTIGGLRLNTRVSTASRRYRFFDAVLIISAVLFLISENWLSTYWLLVLVTSLLLLITYRLKHFLALFISLVLLVTGVYAAEKYLRRHSPVEVLKWGEYPVLQVDSSTIYSLIPNKTTHLKYNNYDYFVRTNSMGFSSEEINLSAKAANEKRILVIGDAFSMPEGLEYNSSFPYLLEQQLRQQYPNSVINVINGGVTGYGPNEEYLQVKKYIASVKPDVVIDEFFVNDFDDINVSPEERRAGIGFYVDLSFMKKYFGSNQTPIHLDAFAQKQFGMADKSVQYNKSLLNYYEADSHYFDDTVTQKLSHFFDGVSDLCKQNQAKFVVMYVPGQIEVSKPSDIAYYPTSEKVQDTTEFKFDRPEAVVNGLCTKKEIAYINTKPYLKSYPVQPVYFTESWHWNKEGHLAIAKYLFNYLTINKLL